MSAPSEVLVILGWSHLQVFMFPDEFNCMCFMHTKCWQADLRYSLCCSSYYSDAFAMNIGFSWLFKTCANLVLFNCIVLAGVKMNNKTNSKFSIFYFQGCISIQT